MKGKLIDLKQKIDFNHLRFNSTMNQINSIQTRGEIDLNFMINRRKKMICPR